MTRDDSTLHFRSLNQCNDLLSRAVREPRPSIENDCQLCVVGWRIAINCTGFCSARRLDNAAIVVNLLRDSTYGIRCESLQLHSENSRFSDFEPRCHKSQKRCVAIGKRRLNDLFHELLADRKEIAAGSICPTDSTLPDSSGGRPTIARLLEVRAVQQSGACVVKSPMRLLQSSRGRFRLGLSGC